MLAWIKKLFTIKDCAAVYEKRIANLVDMVSAYQADINLLRAERAENLFRARFIDEKPKPTLKSAYEFLESDYKKLELSYAQLRDLYNRANREKDTAVEYAGKTLAELTELRRNMYIKQQQTQYHCAHHQELTSLQLAYNTVLGEMKRLQGLLRKKQDHQDFTP